MNVLLVVESSFGNTAQVADAVAAGLRTAGAAVTLADAANAPDVAGFDLVVVGSPTHNLGLPTPKSRQQAIARGGHAPATGVAEWLTGLPRRCAARAAAFDTVVPGPFSGSAAKRIERALRRSASGWLGRESFVVEGNPPALGPGELARAESWGRSLRRG